MAKKSKTKRKGPAMRIPVGHLKAFRQIFGGKIPEGAMQQIRREYRKNPGAPGAAFKRCVAAVSEKGGARSPGGVCAAAGRKKYGAQKFAAMGRAGKKRAAAKRRRNTGDVEVAADKYREFHGKDPDVITEIEETEFIETTFSGIGKLIKLVIFSINGREEVDLYKFKGALLCQNKAGTQLFIKGGDQSVNLEDFGITRPHLQEVLGAVKEVHYDTEKLHLTPEDGGKAIYHHTFGGKRADGKPSRLPLMLYNVRNKKLEFAGGGYDMPEVGIRG